jgi:hypothetical protein
MSSGEVRPQAYRFPQLRNPFVRLPLVEKCEAVLCMNHIAVGTLQPHHASHHEQSPNEQHCDPAQKIVMRGSDLCDQCAQQQPHEQPANVRGVIGACDHCPKK